MRKFLISSAVAASLMSTAALAEISPDGTGEFLVAPAYFANNGFSTNLKLINTNLTHSIVMRAVIRDYIGSSEFDFIVALSPSDVWEGNIKTAADGSVWFESDDDSTYDAGNLKFQMSGVKLGRNFEKGYVEFYPMGIFDEGDSNPVPKMDTNPSAGNQAYEGINLPKALFPRITKLTTDTANAHHLVDKNTTRELVAGYVTLNNNTLNASMTLPMKAFYNVVKPKTTRGGAGVVDATTPITNTFGPGRAATVNTDPKLYIRPEVVYNDLITEAVTVPYENKGVNDGIYFAFWGDYLGSVASDYLPGQETTQCLQAREFDVNVRDMKENRTANVNSPISGLPISARAGVECEMGSVLVSKYAKFDKGMMKLTNISQSSASTNQDEHRHTFAAQGAVEVDIPSAVVTNMRATYVNGKPSYSWTYAPVLGDSKTGLPLAGQIK